MMSILEVQLPHCSAIRGKAIGDETLGMYALVLEQLLQQLDRCRLVAALLHQHVEHFAFVINGAPEEHAFAPDLDDHLVEMPPTGWRHHSASQARRHPRVELLDPAAYRLAADLNASMGKHLLDIANAECEAEAEPHRQTDVSTAVGLQASAAE